MLLIFTFSFLYFVSYQEEIVQISQLAVMLAKKLVTAQKRGETRALCLGLGMVACSMMMYFFIGITIVPFYTKR